MKHPITLRIDTALLQAARLQAQAENRTLTNFVETVLKLHVAGAEEPPGKHLPHALVAAGAAMTRQSGPKRMLSKKASHG